MEYLLIIVVILFATILMVGIGDRFNLPWPVLLTLLTTGIILVPNLPNPEIEPEIILPLFLPPLLWAIGARVTWGSLRRQWRSVLIYSVLLTAVSALAVAWTAWVLIPGMGFALALAIGATVAPPDPVAVEAVAEPVGIPRRIVGVLQTEGLFNDAVSLVLFQAALAVLHVGGEISAPELLADFLLSSVIAVAVGLVLGTIGNYLARNTVDSVGRVAITLVIPFAVYLAAEHLHASGVIAVVIAAIQVNSYKADAFTAEDRITSQAFWHVIELLVTGLAFGLIGLQAGELVYEAGSAILPIIGYGVVISAVTVGVRLVWMLINQAIGRLANNEHATPRTFAESLVMTWSGMRGLVTLALALTIPELENGMRADAIIIVITVLFFTMVFPGLTLPMLVKTLGVSSVGEKDDRAEQELMLVAQKAALGSLRQSAKNASPETVAKVTDMCAAMVRRVEVAQQAPQYQEKMEELKGYRNELARVRSESISAAQKAVLRKRNRYDLEVINSVLHQLDTMEIAGNARPAGGVTLAPPLTTGIINMEKHRKLVEKEVEQRADQVISAEKDPRAL